VDTEGVDGLNMRRLGVQLGAAATAVYWHVKSKDDLVVLAADHVWGEIELPDPDEIGWQAAAAALAGGAHAMISRQVAATVLMFEAYVDGPATPRAPGPAPRGRGNRIHPWRMSRTNVDLDDKLIATLA
jgi:AcrR family transcriptional regulator